MTDRLPEYIVFFDGVCHFCQGSVQFLLKHNSEKDLYFASLQSEEAREVLSSVTDFENLPDSIVFYNNGEILVYSDAILEITNHLSFPWNLAFVFKILPRRYRDFIYKAFAKRRYNFFGKSETCMVPAPEQRERFL